MKQFSLQEYLKNPSRKVVTRDGRSVRVICTDRRTTNRPIIALVEICDNFNEDIFTYTKDGEFNVYYSSRYDLFFASEKKEGWINIFKVACADAYLKESRIYSSKEIAESEGRRLNNYLSTIKIEWED